MSFWEEFDRPRLAVLAERMRLPGSEAEARLLRFMQELEVTEGLPFLTKPGRRWVEADGTPGAEGEVAGVERKRIFVPGWRPCLGRHGMGVELHRGHVASHLLGKGGWIAITRSPSTRIVVIDIDAHMERDRDTLDERRRSVRAALQGAPCVLTG